MHDPDRREANREAQRAGGEARATARRAAKQWAVMGEGFDARDLPTMLRGAMLAVWRGDLSPGQANAIASLAKASVDIETTTALEERIAALEAAQGE